MPIDIDRFEESTEDALRTGGPTNAERILAFLAANPERAYSPKEVHEEADVPRGSVGVVLSRLEDRNLVRHRGEYWAIEPGADVDGVLSTARTAQAATERFGAEDPAAWGPGVDEEDE